MSPTRRKRVMVGSTLARAALTSLIRGYRGRDALVEIAGHRPRGIEHQHGVLGTGPRSLSSAAPGVSVAGEERRQSKRRDRC